MKNNIKYLGICLLLSICFTSCEADDNINHPTRDLGGYAYLVDNKISIFDRDAELEIKFFTAAGVDVESMEIIQGGSVIASGTVNGETATFNASKLEELEVGSQSLRIRTTYSNGDVSEDPFSIAVRKVISLGTENPSTTTLDSLSNVSLSYEIFTLSAGVDDVSLMIKKNADGSYIQSGVDLSTEEGTVVLSETNYENLDFQANDTLYYKFTATSGSLTDEIVSTVVITPKAFTNSNSVTLSDNKARNQLNLATGGLFAEGSEEGEIRFLEPTGFEVINDADIEFVMVDEEFYDNADVLSAAAAFAVGTPIKSVTGLEYGDALVYQVTREVEDEDGNSETFTFYGVMRIGNVTVVNGEAVSFEIDYSEGR